MPGTTLITQTTAPFWLNKYFEIWAFKDFKTHCLSMFEYLWVFFRCFGVFLSPKHRVWAILKGPQRGFWPKNLIFGQFLAPKQHGPKSFTAESQKFLQVFISPKGDFGQKTRFLVNFWPQNNMVPNHSRDHCWTFGSSLEHEWRLRSPKNVLFG